MLLVMMTTTLATANESLELREARWLFAACRPRQVRTIQEFAEQEIVIPNGKLEGRRYRCAYQPYSRLWFEVLQSGRWNRFFATGPVQSGKTLTCWVIPLLYALFELGETVIVGVPSMDTAADKWKEDLLPVIERTRYRSLLPRDGQGSRGGSSTAIRFENGATLRWMSGAGGDKARASFTAGKVFITETDGMDQAGSTSREADKISQLEARTEAYGEDAIVVAECTVSFDTGRTWREYQAGTRSRIALKCPECGEYVTPEREHLVGWADAEDEISAAESAAWMCPNCDSLWSDADRRRANDNAILLHGDQEAAPEGEVIGEAPRTKTLGFRWSAVNNMFHTAGHVAAKEWRASREEDEENAEKRMKQFTFALPYRPPVEDCTPLDSQALIRRTGRAPRGVVPTGTEFLTAACDVGASFLHWVVMAWRPSATPHIIDYWMERVESEVYGKDRAILLALRASRQKLEAGWPLASGGQVLAKPKVTLIDSRYKPAPVVEFCRESGGHYVPSMSYGATQDEAKGGYFGPSSPNQRHPWVGEDCHIVSDAKWGRAIMHANADAWKSWLHEALAMPTESAGALTLYQTSPRDHLPLARALTAEARQEEWVADKGKVVRWVKKRRNNHYLDASYLCCVGGHYCGARRVQADAPAQPRPAGRRIVSSPVRRPDGRPLIQRRNYR